MEEEIKQEEMTEEQVEEPAEPVEEMEPEMEGVSLDELLSRFDALETSIAEQFEKIANVILKSAPATELEEECEIDDEDKDLDELDLTI